MPAHSSSWHPLPTPRSFLVLALLSSLSLHLALLAIDLRPVPAVQPDRARVIRLQPPSADLRSQSEPATASQPEQPAETVAQKKDALAILQTPAKTGPPSADSSTSLPTRAREITPEISSLGPQTPNGPNLADRLLDEIRSNVRQLDLPDGPNRVIKPPPVPTLPSRSGWINQYVGTVEPTMERWQNPDGSRATRVVLANGQIICGQARAPTTFELFNPQFSLNIMTFRDCGRQRPTPADTTDPWYRGPTDDQ